LIIWAGVVFFLAAILTSLSWSRPAQSLHGIIGTGLTWAIGWAVLWGAVLLIMAGFDLLEGWDLRYTVRAIPGVAGVGFAAGSGFGVVLSVFERDKKLENLSFKRVALWGGIGGLALAAVFGLQYLPQTVVLTLLGVGSATGSVALAKRADRKLMEGDEPLPALEGE
jgi:hypothetical protein